MIVFWRVLLVLGMCLSAVVSVFAQEPLPPHKAYPMQVRVLDAKTVEIQFDIQPQYYLYKDRFKFSIEPGAIQLGTPALPKGQMKDDPQFGWVETYHDTLRYTLPIEPGEARQFVLTVSSQGCWEGGVCYPPL